MEEKLVELRDLLKKARKKRKKAELTERGMHIIMFAFVTFFLTIGMLLLYLPQGIAESRAIAARLRELYFDRSLRLVYNGDKLPLTPVIVPSEFEHELVWGTQDSDILSVSQGGEVTALDIGEAEVTVTGENGLSASVRVRVVPKRLPPDSDLPQAFAQRLRIVNTSSPLEKSYEPELVRLSGVSSALGGNTRTTPDCAQAYKKLYKAMVSECGEGVRIISTYRSYSKQASLYKAAVERRVGDGMSRREAEANAALSTQLPGCSEHQLGESIDVSTGYTTAYSFGETKRGRWLAENCHRFGFILRYPSGKQEITGIKYEPWHIRYVGVAHAKYIYEHSLCLEEYVELQAQAERAAEDYAKAHTAEEAYSELLDGNIANK